MSTPADPFAFSTASNADLLGMAARRQCVSGQPLAFGEVAELRRRRSPNWLLVFGALAAVAFALGYLGRFA